MEQNKPEATGSGESRRAGTGRVGPQVDRSIAGGAETGAAGDAERGDTLDGQALAMMIEEIRSYLQSMEMGKIPQGVEFRSFVRNLESLELRMTMPPRQPDPPEYRGTVLMHSSGFP